MNAPPTDGLFLLLVERQLLKTQSSGLHLCTPTQAKPDNTEGDPLSIDRDQLDIVHLRFRGTGLSSNVT